MLYHLIIRSTPNSKAAELAPLIASELAQRHPINSVFFMQDAVLNLANGNAAAWREFHQQSGLALSLCSAAMQTLALDLEVLRQQSGIAQLEIMGLGSHVSDSQQAERVMEL